MLNLRGYTKQQKFGLLTLAIRKTWEKFEAALLYNKFSLENTDVDLYQKRGYYGSIRSGSS